MAQAHWRQLKSILSNTLDEQWSDEHWSEMSCLHFSDDELLCYHYKLNFWVMSEQVVLSKENQYRFRHVLNWEAIGMGYRYDQINHNAIGCAYDFINGAICGTCFTHSLGSGLSRRKMWLFILRYHHKLDWKGFGLNYSYDRFLYKMKEFFYNWIDVIVKSRLPLKGSPRL